MLLAVASIHKQEGIKLICISKNFSDWRFILHQQKRAIHVSWEFNKLKSVLWKKGCTPVGVWKNTQFYCQRLILTKMTKKPPKMKIAVAPKLSLSSKYWWFLDAHYKMINNKVTKSQQIKEPAKIYEFCTLPCFSWMLVGEVV